MLRPRLNWFTTLAISATVALVAVVDARTPAATTNLFVSATSAKAELGGACSAPRPCLRITDALNEARRLRSLGQTQKIHIHVAPGVYTGTAQPDPNSPALEDLPILINISDVTLQGATELETSDDGGPPTCPEDGCHGSDITTSQTPTSADALVLVTPTIGGGPVRGVEIRNLSIYYATPSQGLAVYFDRVRDIRIEKNFVANGSGGIIGRFSTFAVVGNVGRGGSPVFGVFAGNDAWPSEGVARNNRFEKGLAGAIICGTTDIRNFLRLNASLPFVQPPLDASWVGTVMNAAILDNAMTDNTWLGMRVIQLFNQTLGNPVPASGAVDVTITGNEFLRNVRAGLSFDAGFPNRARPVPLSGWLQATLRGNRYEDNGSWPIVITFTRPDPPGGANNLAMWKFLEGATYEFWDADNELAGAHIVNPPCDTFLASCSSPVPPAEPGPALSNEIIVHGVATMFFRASLRARPQARSSAAARGAPAPSP